MLKKLASLLLSLLLFLTLLPSQAHTSDAPKSVEPSAQIGYVDSESSENPELPIMPQTEPVPDVDDNCNE